MESIASVLPAFALVVAGILLVVMVVMQSMQISALRRRIDAITGGSGEGNLEDVLIAHLDSVHAVGQELDELMARVAVLESSTRHHLGRQGLVRFNPFPVSDTGGNQSFALALLDETDHGFIITSLHSRNGTRIYAKAVVAGKVDAQMSEEENQALEEARAIRPQRTQPPSRSRGAGSRDATRARDAAPAARDASTGVAVRPTLKAARVATPPAAAQVEDEASTEGPAVAPQGPAVAPEGVHPGFGKGQSKGELAPEEPAPEERTGARPGRVGDPS